MGGGGERGEEPEDVNAVYPDTQCHKSKGKGHRLPARTEKGAKVKGGRGGKDSNCAPGLGSQRGKGKASGKGYHDTMASATIGVVSVTKRSECPCPATGA